jgi:hypothetical protein
LDQAQLEELAQKSLREFRVLQKEMGPLNPFQNSLQKQVEEVFGPQASQVQKALGSPADVEGEK